MPAGWGYALIPRAGGDLAPALLVQHGRALRLGLADLRSPARSADGPANRLLHLPVQPAAARHQRHLRLRIGPAERPQELGRGGAAGPPRQLSPTRAADRGLESPRPHRPGAGPLLARLGCVHRPARPEHRLQRAAPFQEPTGLRFAGEHPLRRIAARRGAGEPGRTNPLGGGRGLCPLGDRLARLHLDPGYPSGRRGGHPHHRRGTWRDPDRAAGAGPLRQRRGDRRGERQPGARPALRRLRAAGGGLPARRARLRPRPPPLPRLFLGQHRHRHPRLADFDLATAPGHPLARRRGAYGDDLRGDDAGAALDGGAKRAKRQYRRNGRNGSGENRDAQPLAQFRPVHSPVRNPMSSSSVLASAGSRPRSAWRMPGCG